MKENFETLKFNDSDSGKIFFHYRDETDPVMVISKEGFFWKGEKVEDAHNVYERFNEWLTKASLSN